MCFLLPHVMTGLSAVTEDIYGFLPSAGVSGPQ